LQDTKLNSAVSSTSWILGHRDYLGNTFIRLCEQDTTSRVTNNYASYCIS